MSPPDLRNADPSTAFPMALKAMRNTAFLKTPKYQQQQKRALKEGAHPHIVEFAEKLVKRMATMGIPMFPHCVVRTREEQQAAFDRRVSWDSPKDGLWPHMAFAVDIVHGVLGWMDNPDIPHAWHIVGHVGKEVALSMGIKIEWGGDWVVHDPAHFELVGWQEIAVTGDDHWKPIKL
jgi:hypothetical protein